MLDRLKRMLGVRPFRKDAPAVAKLSAPEPSVTKAVIKRPPASPAPRPLPVRLPSIRRADIDPDAEKVVGRLSRHGHTAYLVGGCVRDLLLERQPKDFDISTSAVPRQVKRLFRNSRIIGRRFKLVHVFFRNDPQVDGEKIIEVATFRATQEPGDEGSDLLITRDNVFGSPEEDAQRRDFTVNSLFYDLENEKIIDHAGGLSDLRARVLRTIGDPDIRLREDPVRILRAIKFAARLGFSIDPATLSAMRRHRTDIPRCAAPRLLEELFRILRSGAAVDAFGLLGETRVLEVLLPEVDGALSAKPALVGIYRGVLGEFDRRVAAGEKLEASVVLASLFLPLMPWQANADADGDLQTALIDVVAPVAERLRISRRDKDEVRRILLSMRKMVPGYRAKRFSCSGLARREYFPRLLKVFDIHCRASGHWGAAVREWERVSREFPPEGGEERPASGPRRRRRGRGRGKGEQEHVDQVVDGSAGDEVRKPRPRRRRPPRSGSAGRRST